MPTSRTARTAATSLTLAALAGTALAQPSLDFLGSFSTSSMSGDGSVLAGSTSSGFVRWTQATGVVNIGGSTGNGQAAVSRDGTAISGTAIDPMINFSEMSLWQGGTNWLPLGFLGGLSGTSVSSGWGINDDGTSVVGLGWWSANEAHAVQWTQGGTLVDLGSTVVMRSSRANCVNGDGSIVAGWQDSSTGFRQGAIWVNGVQQVLLDDAMVPLGEVQNINSAGDVLCGAGGGGSGGGWVKTPAGVSRVGVLPGFEQVSYVTDVTDDGSVAVGFSVQLTSRRGFAWTPTGGMVPIEDYLLSKGVPVPVGANLNTPVAISDDGSVIAGFTFLVFGPNTGAWRAVLSTPCVPDITTTAIPGSPGYLVPNGVLNNDDFFAFLTEFAGGNLAVADVTTTAVPGSPGYGTPNGVINNDDFFYYLTLFAAGC